MVGDGRAKERLENLVQEYGLQENVVFVGRVSEQEAERYVHFADCAYLSFQPNPLFHLVLPAKLQTYLACGAPILAAVDGESAAVVEEAQCGVVASQQVSELAQSVRKMMALSSDERKAMADNAQRYSAEYFNKNILIDQLLELMSKDQ